MILSPIAQQFPFLGHEFIPKNAGTIKYGKIELGGIKTE
jgi:hypothetical protein